MGRYRNVWSNRTNGEGGWRKENAGEKTMPKTHSAAQNSAINKQTGKSLLRIAANNKQIILNIKSEFFKFKKGKNINKM